MRQRIHPAALLAAAAVSLAGCGSSPPQTASSTQSNTTTTTTTQTTTAQSPAQTSTGAPPISSAHGGATTTAGAPPSATGAAAGEEKPSGIDTAALDAKVEKAVAKAKTAGASEADKRAAAAAYVERGRVFYDAGQPRLYKFALGDFRRALKLQPDNAEAREKMNMIVSIYQQMGRPVPTNGSEPDL